MRLIVLPLLALTACGSPSVVPIRGGISPTGTLTMACDDDCAVLQYQIVGAPSKATVTWRVLRDKDDVTRDVTTAVGTGIEVDAEEPGLYEVAALIELDKRGRRVHNVTLRTEMTDDSGETLRTMGTFTTGSLPAEDGIYTIDQPTEICIGDTNILAVGGCMHMDMLNIAGVVVNEGSPLETLGEYQTNSFGGWEFAAPAKGWVYRDAHGNVTKSFDEFTDKKREPIFQGQYFGVYVTVLQGEIWHFGVSHPQEGSNPDQFMQVQCPSTLTSEMKFGSVPGY